MHNKSNINCGSNKKNIILISTDYINNYEIYVTSKKKRKEKLSRIDYVTGHKQIRTIGHRHV